MQKDGPLRIYKHPTPTEIFIIGADVAQGLEGGDASTAFVMDSNYNQCASYYSHIDVDVFACNLVRLAQYYNNALLAPEINGPGLAVINKIKELNYTFLYQREYFEKHEIDIQQRLGWLTTTKSKPLMIHGLIAAIRDNSIKINDIDLLRELATLVYEPDGNCVLNSKDRSVACMIALQAMKQAPLQLKYKAIHTDDEIKPEKFETFGERQRRISKRGADSYFR